MHILFFSFALKTVPSFHRPNVSSNRSPVPRLWRAAGAEGSDAACDLGTSGRGASWLGPFSVEKVQKQKAKRLDVRLEISVSIHFLLGGSSWWVQLHAGHPRLVLKRLSLRGDWSFKLQHPYIGPNKCHGHPRANSKKTLMTHDPWQLARTSIIIKVVYKWLGTMVWRSPFAYLFLGLH